MIKKKMKKKLFLGKAILYMFLLSWCHSSFSREPVFLLLPSRQSKLDAATKEEEEYEDAAVGYDGWRRSSKNSKRQNRRGRMNFFLFSFLPSRAPAENVSKAEKQISELTAPKHPKSHFVCSLKHEKSASLKSLLDSCSLFSTLKCKQWGCYIQYNLHRVLLSICSIRKTLIKIEKALQLAHAIDFDSCNALVRTAWYCTSPVDAPLFSPSQFPVPIWSSHLFFPLTRYFMGRWTNQSETK